MPKKKVIVEGQIILDDKGTLKKSAKGAHSVDRRLKGAARTSSSATKNFSKMSQGISGGLVPAYATLAANIFAISAAFRFLKDAANYRILLEGQLEFAAKTGDALSIMTSRIREATGGQLAFNEAAQAVAIGRAAGVTADQLERLAKIAKNASIALGRDVTDSFNRLVRGVTKAEPELLDELGIILRLDIATEKYARTLNKTANQLNIFEKSQAVTNEVLAQGESKFAEFETTVNQFEKLAVAFDDMINKIKLGLAGVAEFMAGALSKNVAALGGAFALLGSGILRSITPQVPMVDRTAAAAGAQKNIASWYTGKSQEKFAQGTYGNKEIVALERSINAKKSQVINYENFVRSEAQKTLQIIKMHNLQREADEGTTWMKIKAKFKLSLFNMQIEYGKFVGTLKWMQAGLTKAIGALGWLGMLASVVGIVGSLIDKYRDPATKEFEENQKKIADRFTEQAEAVRKILDKLTEADDTFTNLVKKGRLAGAIDFKGGPEAFGTEAMGAKMTKSGTKLSKNQRAVLAGIVGELETAKDIVGATSVAGLAIQEDIDILAKAATGGWGTAIVDKKGFQGLLDILIRLENEGIPVLEKLSEMEGLPNIFKNAGDEFGKAISQMKKATSPLGQAGGAIINAQATIQKIFDRAKDPETADQVVWQKKAFSKEENDVFRQMLGLDVVKQVLDDFEGAGQAKEFQRLLGEKARDIAAVEKEIMTERTNMQTRLTDTLRDQPKIIQAQLQKQHKVADIEQQISNIREARRVADEAHTVVDQLTLDQEQAKLKLLEAQLATSKRAASFAGQAYQTFVDTLGSSLTQALNDFATGAKNMKDAFLDMTQSILKAMVQIMVQQTAIKALGFMGFAPTGRGGGIFSSPGYKSFAGGGIATGSQSGYLAKLHGTEAVVPLGNDKAIPVEFKGGGGSVSNITVNVAAGGQQQTTTARAGERERKLGQMIAAAVQGEILDQQRPGGILSPYGGGDI